MVRSVRPEKNKRREPMIGNQNSGWLSINNIGGRTGATPLSPGLERTKAVYRKSRPINTIRIALSWNNF